MLVQSGERGVFAVHAIRSKILNSVIGKEEVRERPQTEENEVIKVG